MVDSVSVRFKNTRVEKILLNIRIQWNEGTACLSECVLKTLACRGLRVGPFLSCGRPTLAEHFAPEDSVDPATASKDTPPPPSRKGL